MQVFCAFPLRLKNIFTQEVVDDVQELDISVINPTTAKSTLVRGNMIEKE